MQFSFDNEESRKLVNFKHVTDLRLCVAYQFTSVLKERVLLRVDKNRIPEKEKEHDIFKTILTYLTNYAIPVAIVEPGKEVSKIFDSSNMKWIKTLELLLQHDVLFLDVKWKWYKTDNRGKILSCNLIWFLGLLTDTILKC